MGFSSRDLICWPSPKGHEEDEDVLPLPRHLWCWVAQHLDATACAATLQCSHWLMDAFDVRALWLHHCLVNDLARPVVGPDAGWIYSFAPRASVAECVDWRLLLRTNMRLRNCPSVWVRVQDVDLRLPVPPGHLCRKALMTQISRTVSVGDDRRPSDSSCDGHERPRWPMRLRHLQWGGRPGTLLGEGPSLLGGHYLLEWMLPQKRGWPLPPTCAPASASSRGTYSLSSKLCYQGMPVLTWLHGVGAGHGDAAVHSVPTRGEEQALMIRIVSLLVPRELWLSVPTDATWGTLHQEIAKMLRRESPLLAELSRPLTYYLMDLERPGRKATIADSKPLRELFWAQSETLHVELESPTSHAAALKRARGEDGGDAANGPSLAVLIRREAAFLEAPDDPLDGPAVQSCFGFSRQMTEPAPMQSAGWSRQMSEPVPGRGYRATLRGFPDVLSVDRDALEPPLSLASPSRGGRCASRDTALRGTEYATEGERPTTADGVVDQRRAPRSGISPPRRGLAALDGGSGRADSAESTEWEDIVPHYQPHLLQHTFLTRQFEFHPTMPEVMLMGDKKGSVNILNLETEEVHMPLSVGSCPLLGLAWMRRHPQRAVCGASHSGRIALLEYDPLARPYDPALQKIQTLEEFPKLSSLSVNCTDDFLLASGISPNVAIYDLQTGRVLHRACGVHEHFINISRFCHHSPHIFATASFDHTCKVWDLRQPLVHDRPVKTLTTGSHNVMCVFSPDDRHVLCSGVDTRVMQFEVASWVQTPSHFPLREPVHRERYRRSTYLATGRHFVTAATEESHMHLMTVEGEKLGVVDFRGVVQHWSDRGQNSGGRSPTDSGCLHQVPQLARRLESRIFPARAHHSHLSPQRHAVSSFAAQDRFGDPGLCAVGEPRQSLVQGRVHLDDADPNGGSSRNNHEFIQSIRTHPLVKNRVGVLLSQSQAERSYVALVDLDPQVLEA